MKLNLRGFTAKFSNFLGRVAFQLQQLHPYPKNSKILLCIRVQTKYKLNLMLLSKYSPGDLDMKVKAIEKNFIEKKKNNQVTYHYAPGDLDMKVTAIEGNDQNGYKCEICGKNFTLKGNLRQHMAKLHAGIKDLDNKSQRYVFIYSAKGYGHSRQRRVTLRHDASRNVNARLGTTFCEF